MRSNIKRRTKLFLSSSMISSLTVSTIAPISVAIQKNNTTNELLEISSTTTSTSIITKQSTIKEIKSVDIDQSLALKRILNRLIFLKKNQHQQE